MGDEQSKLPKWLKEYSLSIGLIFLIAAVVAIQERFVAVTLLALGVVFLSVSMAVAVISGPPGLGGKEGEETRYRGE